MYKSEHWEVKGIAMCAVYQVTDPYNSHIVDFLKRDCSCRFVQQTFFLLSNNIFLHEWHFINFHLQAMATFRNTMWACVCRV